MSSTFTKKITYTQISCIVYGRTGDNDGEENPAPAFTNSINDIADGFIVPVVVA